MARAFRSLAFRTLAPIVAFGLVLGTGSVILVYVALSKYVEQQASSDLKWRSSTIYRIVDLSLDALQRAGKGGDEPTLRYHKVNSLIAIEDFARVNEITVTVHDLREQRSTEFGGRLDRTATSGLPAGVDRFFFGGKPNLSHTVRFEPWQWDITLTQDNRPYLALVRDLSIGAGGFTFLFVSGIIGFVYYLTTLATKPIQRIVQDLERNEPPQYRGIAEFEYLSQSIAAMMHAVREHSNMLEEQVAQRTAELKYSNELLEMEIAVRNEAEEGLAERTRELARSNADLEQFAYVASHDLQEPLRMVGSYMQLIEQRYKDKLDKDAREFIGFAVDGAKRMQGLINDLLAYSRISTKGGAFEPVEGEKVLAAALHNLRFAIEESGACITHDPLPTVRADATQLAQVFQNFIGNAIKFRGDKPPQIHVGAQQQDGFWQFSVRDNGIGIAPEYFEKIFVLFQRLHGRSAYPGTGIGLAICKKVVERHGGRVWVESAPQGGSCFYFTVPVHKENQS
jgi:signal transduction histidine kinase